MAEVTVLLPVYNGAKFLRCAIKSILNQTFTDFELLIINDGSNDETKKIIHSFSDDRIRYFENETNQGLIKTLNDGIELSTGTFIARMDADDISMPTRIEEQITFIKKNPEVDIVGTWFSIINSDMMVCHPLTNAECQIKLLRSTVLGHPTVLFKRSIINSSLRFFEESKYAEDYRFWAEASIKGKTIANLPEALLKYRVHQQQVSTRYKKEQDICVSQIRLWYARQYFGCIISGYEELYQDFINDEITTIQSYQKAINLTSTLKKINKKNHLASQKYLEKLFNHLLNNTAGRCYKLCLDCNAVNLIKALFDIRFYTNTSSRDKLRFILRSIR